MTENRSWLKGRSFMILIALLIIAAAQGLPTAMLAMAVLPVACAVLAYTDGLIGVVSLCAAAAAVCVWRFPFPVLALALGWCICSGAISLIPLRKPLVRPMLWVLLCVLGWSAFLLMATEVFGRPLTDGIARAMCELIDLSPQRNTILLNAYSMGLARLESDVTVSSLNFVLMPEGTRLQLLYSLRVSLEEMLPSGMCNGIIWHTALTTLLCTALPDWRRRKNGEKGLLPPMEEWYMPRGIGLAVFALCLGWLFATLSTGGIDEYMGLLSLAVFQAAYTLQGVCFLLWLEKRMGIRSFMRSVWAVVLSLLAPIVPIVMGLIDQRRDARHLRPDEEGKTV